MSQKWIWNQVPGLCPTPSWFRWIHNYRLVTPTGYRFKWKETTVLGRTTNKHQLYCQTSWRRGQDMWWCHPASICPASGMAMALLHKIFLSLIILAPLTLFENACESLGKCHLKPASSQEHIISYIPNDQCGHCWIAFIAFHSWFHRHHNFH